MTRMTDAQLEGVLRLAYVRIGCLGDAWIHEKTGGLYTVTCITLSSDTLVPLVTYSKVGSNVLWSRSLDEFLDGRFQRVNKEPTLNQKGTIQ